MSTPPIFAIVGRANKGKSSIVAALAEDDRVEIGPIPGTTIDCAEYPVQIDHETIFTLVDTPGFEDAPRALAWMRERATDAASRSRVVADFVAAHATGADFSEECKLLRPILAGASILYVVDGTKPYRQNYEAEMEILRWTGRPGMALINRIGEGDHAADWRRALEQYFRIVREFDAFRVSFTERMRVLTAFRELRPEWSDSIGKAIAALRADRRQRHELALAVLSELLIHCLTFTFTLSLAFDEPVAARRLEIERGFLDGLRQKEHAARRQIEVAYKYHHELFRLRELERPVFEDDLFAESTWRSFGLDATQLVAAYAVTGALLGGVIDAAVGGASILLGTAIGGLIGTGVGLRHAAQRAGGEDLFDIMKNLLEDKTQHRVGPLRDINFPFIVLDRAILHYRSILGRTHAQREVVPVDDTPLGVVATLPLGERTALAKLFQKIRRSGAAISDGTRRELHERLGDLLRQQAPEAEPD
jgi:GTPase Era involved in 16S rRNA processing